MKKLILIEMVLLSVLLIVAVLISSERNTPTFSQDDLTANSNATGTTNTIPTEDAETGPTWNTYPEDRQLTAQQYFVYDCTEKSYLINSGTEDDRIYPASITKLFTAYVAMYYLHPDSYITVGDAIDMIAPGSSVAGLKQGDRLSTRQLLEGMLLNSGNDAAYVLAAEVGRVITGSAGLDSATAVNVFMGELNRRVKALGMPNTHFVNPDGIHDPNHYTTVKDIVTMATICMTDNTIMRNAVAVEADIVLHGETLVWKNTNALVDPNSPYYCPYALGLKTGQTPEAGSCLLSVFRKDGQFLVIGVFGAASHTDRFDDSLQLFNEIVLK